MNIFKKAKVRRTVEQKQTKHITPPSTPIQGSSNAAAYNSRFSHHGASESPHSQGKKKKSAFKKFKNLFRKSPKTSTTSSNFHKHPLTSREPSVGQVSNYYSNNTDGFEVILQGEKLQYEENPKKESTSTPMKLCGTEQTCEPLFDWDNFINILSGNLSDFYQLFSGEEKKSSTEEVQSTGNQTSSVHGKLEKSVQKSQINAEPMNGMYRQSLGVQERGAMKTTPLNQQSNAAMKSKIPKLDTGRPVRGSYTSNVNMNVNRNVPLSNPMAEEEERIERHPYTRTNDAPIWNNDTSKNRHFIPPSKDMAPEEEIYDTAFTLNFLKEVSTIGIILTYIQVPEDGQPFSSEIVNLTIKPGLAQGSRLLEPKLCWTNIENPFGEGTFVSLLGIHSIRTSINSEEDNDNPFFTITTNSGDVYAFESPTISERNHIVHGIKNVVAWLTYHLVTGNMATGTELVSDLDEERGEYMGELPSLKTPVQAMNDMTHAFLS